LEADRNYRVVTTDRTRKNSSLEMIIQGSQYKRPLDGATMKVLSNPDGSPLTLRKAVLDTFKEFRNAHGIESVTPMLLEKTPSEIPSMWLLRVRQISFRRENFEGVSGDAFAAVPETMASTESSATLGSTADVALDYSSAALRSDLRFRSSFSKIYTELDDVEVEDDMKLSTSFSVPKLRFPSQSRLQLMPYSEVLYDSEFTPIELEDGSFNPLQSDLSLTMGVATLPAGMLRVLRIGGLVNRDLARVDEKTNEFGGKMEWETKKSLGSWLLWTSLGDMQVYADTPDDDASDLRLRLYMESRVSLPLARYMAVSLYGQGLLMRGRTAVNDELGMAYNLGIALDMLGAFEL